MQKIILASQSPRRKQILQEAGIEFEIRTKDTPENFPDNIPKHDVPVYLAKKKAQAFLSELNKDEIIITADTVVIIDNEVLNKPANKEEAIQMLQKISGRMHEVVTGVCISSLDKQESFSDLTKVYFLPMSLTDIEFYVDNFKPFDKAGSYGIQEYIGYIGIEKIDGSYFNVMGLPVHKIIPILRKYSKS